MRSKATPARSAAAIPISKERGYVGDVAVGLRRYERKLLCVDKRPVRRRALGPVWSGRGLDQEFDRHSAGRDPEMRPIDVQAIAVTNGAVMDHKAALAPPRAGPQMIEVS